MIEFVQTAEGRATPSGSVYSYDYMLKDHLGNTRVLIKQNGSILDINDYYAFGLEIGDPMGPSPDNNYKYNGKEWNTDLSLNAYDYGARFYDPVIGRFNTIDPLAEKMTRFSTYAYGFNNPIRFVDPDGREGKDWVMGLDNKPKWDINVTSADDKDLRGRTYIGKSAEYTATNGAEVELQDGGAWSYKNQTVWQVPDGDGDEGLSGGGGESAFVQGLLNAGESDHFSTSSVIGMVGTGWGVGETINNAFKHMPTATADDIISINRTAAVMKSIGRAVGGAGVVYKGLEAFRSGGNISAGEWAGIGISAIGVAVPAVGIIDLGVEMVTGTSVSDRIANGINEALKK